MLLFKCVAPHDQLERDRQGFRRMPSSVCMGSNRGEINVLNASIRKEIKTSTPHIFNMSWNPNSTWKQSELPWYRKGCTLKERT